MSQVQFLIKSVEKSRASYLNTVQILSKENIEFKKDENSWNIIEITEHLYWAEFLGVAVMAKVLNEILEGKKELKYDSKNKDLSIEKIVDLTWKEKEKVPDIAAPRVRDHLNFGSLHQEK